ncbi:hypothetical protein LCGC14_3048300, partial [marine sediment metagenome]
MRRFYTILAILVFTSLGLVYGQTATLVPDSALTEQRLDVRLLSIKLGGGESFINTTFLGVEDFNLAGFPVGTTFSGTPYTSSDSVVLSLDYDGTDFDTDSLNAHIVIMDSVLTVSSSDLPTDSVTVYSYIEIPFSRLTPDSVLTEQRLDQRSIKIKLGGDETFISPGTLAADDFTLVGFPAGTTVNGSLPGSSDSIVLLLAFNGTDFDSDSLNAHVLISASVLTVSSSDLSTDSLAVLSYLEIPSASLVSDSVLTESRLDARSVTITLDDELFKDYGSLVAGNFVLINAPTVTNIENVTGNSPTEVVIDLAFSGPDFDTDYEDFAVDID